MWLYLLRRIVTSSLAVIVATMLVFGLSRFLADPRYTLIGQAGYGMSQETWEKLGDELHLNDPVPIQFGYWAADVLRGDFGKDLIDDRPVMPKLQQKIWPTAKLGLVAWVIATVIGIPIGVISAVTRGSMIDYFCRAFALFGQAVPTFFAGILSILCFTVWLDWLPAAGMGEGFSVKNYIMPATVLAWLPAAGYLRFTRSAMLEVLDSEYIKLARAKGVSNRSVIWNHAFRNASLIPLTATALVLAGFITGSVLVEAVFAWPGIGQYAVQAVQTNNINVIVPIVLIFTVLFIFTNLIVDLMYGLLDPRIRYT